MKFVISGLAGDLAVPDYGGNGFSLSSLSDLLAVVSFVSIRLIFHFRSLKGLICKIQTTFHPINFH